MCLVKQLSTNFYTHLSGTGKIDLRYFFKWFYLITDAILIALSYYYL